MVGNLCAAFNAANQHYVVNGTAWYYTYVGICVWSSVRVWYSEIRWMVTYGLRFVNELSDTQITNLKVFFCWQVIVLFGVLFTILWSRLTQFPRSDDWQHLFYQRLVQQFVTFANYPPPLLSRSPSCAIAPTSSRKSSPKCQPIPLYIANLERP